MQNLIALTSRELKALWYSPVIYVIGAAFMVIQGFVFWFLVAALIDPRMDASVTIGQAFFSPTFFYTISMLVTIPFLTMRTFSEEKRTGTIEFLLTAPVTDTQVVLSKFFGAWIAYIFLWSLTVVFFILLHTIAPFDWAPVLGGYIGTWLLGGALISFGILTSSLTRNQMIAAFLCFAILLLLFCVGILGVFINDPETTRLIRYLSILDHVESFSKGILDTRPIVFYLSITTTILFLAVRVIGNPRWRT